MTFFGRYKTWGLDADPEDDWRLRAACRVQAAETFFPVGYGKTAQRQEQRAQAFCRLQCSVIDQCGAWAIANGEMYGVWGGMSENELQSRVRAAGTESRPRMEQRHGVCSRGHPIKREAGGRCHKCNRINNSTRRERAC